MIERRGRLETSSIMFYKVMQGVLLAFFYGGVVCLARGSCFGEWTGMNMGMIGGWILIRALHLSSLTREG